MGNIQFTSNGILFTANGIAFDPSCCCGGVPCANCDTGSTPIAVQVTLSGIGTDACANCADYNNTFILTQDPVDSCKFRYDFDPSPCGDASYLLVTLAFDGIYCQLWIQDTGSGPWRVHGAWRILMASPYDCIAGYDLDLYVNEWAYCEFQPGSPPVNATCTVSGL